MIFAIGDIVELIEDHPDDNADLVAGCTGRVVGDDQSLRGWVSVEWDREISGGHTCGDKCPDGYGWNVPQRVLKLLPSTEIKDTDIATIEDLIGLFQGYEPCGSASV